MSTRRWLVPLCLASALWAFSFGLSAPLASLVLQDAGYDAGTIGLNTGTYYLGIALAAVFVPIAMRRWGYGALLVGTVASGITVIAFPWGGSEASWFLLRALNGMAGALSLIPLETYVNHTSSSEKRAENFGYYAFCIALGMGMGSLVGMDMHAHAPRLAFALGGLAAVAASVVVLCWRPILPAIEARNDRSPLELRRNFLSYGSAWCQGFLEGGMVGLLPVYLLAAGLSDAGAGYLMGGLMIGVILFQVPVAWLADRKGRTNVLIGCYAVSITGMICLLASLGVAWLAVWLFAVGACTGAFYPLGLTILGERTQPAALARANSWYLAINCMGSVTGPVIAGTAMDWFGNGWLFITGVVAVLGVLVAWVALTRFKTHAVELIGPGLSEAGRTAA